MKIFFGELILLFLIITLLSSCSSLKVTYPVKSKNKFAEIAVISTYVDIKKPVFPLLDAAIINKETNSISSELTKLFKDYSSVIRENVSKQLMDNFSCKVIYGASLHSNLGINNLKETFNFEHSLERNDKAFPKIVEADNEFNFFEFNKWNTISLNIIDYFDHSINYKNTVTEVCNKMQVDHLAVTYSVLKTFPGGLILSDKISLYTYFYLFNKNGECIANGINFSEPTGFKGKEVEGYKLALNKYSELFLPIIEKVASKYK